MEEVAELADSVTVLDRGRTVASGAVREVLTQTALLEPRGLALPEATEVAQRLRARGVAIAPDLLTPHEVQEALWQALPR